MAERSKAPDSSDVVHYGGCRNSGLRTEAWVQIPLLIALLCCSSSFRKKNTFKSKQFASLFDKPKRSEEDGYKCTPVANSQRHSTAILKTKRRRRWRCRASIPVILTCKASALLFKLHPRKRGVKQYTHKNYEIINNKKWPNPPKVKPGNS